MTMTFVSHPDDERLAALAGADADATADRALVEHVSACERCRPVVEELRVLRSALQELPDLTPSRPLQLVPPVPEPEPVSARGAWLRRLMAPVAAAGLVVAIIGAAGTAGVFDQGLGFGQAAAPAGASPAEKMAEDRGPGAGSMREEATASGQGDSEASARDRASQPLTAAGTPSVGPSGSPAPRPDFEAGGATHQADDSASRGDDLSATGTPSPWVIVLVAGLAIAVGAMGARWLIPTAG
jgi:hypothetical protein